MPFLAFWLLVQPCISILKDQRLSLAFNSYLLPASSPDAIFWILQEFYTNPKWPLLTDFLNSPIFLLIFTVLSQQVTSQVRTVLHGWKELPQCCSSTLKTQPATHLALVKQSLTRAVLCHAACADAWRVLQHGQRHSSFRNAPYWGSAAINNEKQQLLSGLAKHSLWTVRQHNHPCCVQYQDLNF